MTVGYGQDPEKILSANFASEGYDELVILRDVDFYSLCEHHLLVFAGRATVAYLPNGRVVGLSKLARLVDCFARRLQLQERLTRQIAEAVETHLRPRGHGVIVRATHFCMCARGVGKPRAEMVTSALGGSLKEDASARSEFLRLAGVS